MRESNSMYVGDEYQLRLGIYMNNKRLVGDFNRAERSYRVGLNQFAACTEAEYKAMLGRKPSGFSNHATKISKVAAPDSWDWRDKKIVNEVKNQASCGSCWAFSVIQAQESQWALKKNELKRLSEQNLVDCVTTCSGCNGGLEDKAYDYVIKYQSGLFMLEDDYPYTARDESCKFDKTKGVCPVKSYMVPAKNGNEEELKAGLYEGGVVSIAIDASNWDFQLYSGGVYNPTKCGSGYYDLDHAVGLVGYGVDNGVDYWIVRNSWGSTWGEQGYIRMIRNKDNHCGVATDPIIPLVE
jgi:cathepsin L